MRWVHATGSPSNQGLKAKRTARRCCVSAGYHPRAYSARRGGSIRRLRRILLPEFDDVRIVPEALSPPPTQSPLIIEGAGGVLVPLTERQVFADVFARWQIPVILCARTGLGTINHTLLSLEALRCRSIPVFGVVFIGDEQADTQGIIAELGQVNCLGRLPLLDPLTPGTLAQAFHDHFDISCFQKASQ